MSDAPDSLSPLPPIIQRGLWAVSATAALSLTTTAALSLYLIYRIVTVKTSANSRVSRYSVLLLNLIFADFIQAVGFAFNIHWLRYDAIIDGSAACLSQGKPKVQTANPILRELRVCHKLTSFLMRRMVLHSRRCRCCYVHHLHGRASLRGHRL